MAKNDRFIKIYTQGVANATEIWIDKITGVNYLFHSDNIANTGGITPLLDKEGKPVITPIDNK